MRFAILGLMLALTSAAPAPPAPAPPAPTVPLADAGVVRLAADAESRWVPFDLTPGNQVRFTLMLEGRPLTAVLDTGVSVSVLARGSAAVDAARLRPGGRATAIGGDVTVGWMPTRTLTLGGLTRTGGGVAVTALPAAATGSGSAGVDMLIGADLLGGHALDIDYPARRFRLIASGRLPFTGSVAPLGLLRRWRVYASELALGGQMLRPMVVDTGDGSAVTVTKAGWAGAGLARLATTSSLAQGLAGPMVTDLAIVPSLSVGALAARSVEVRSEVEGSFSQAIGAAGRIGTGFLQRYRVLLDPRAGRMVFSPGPKTDAPPLRSTSGLLLGLERDRLTVLHVMKNGPAAAAGGWQAGDTICAVDGVAVSPAYAASADARWSAGAPGRVVTLALCDGRTRTLTLAHFY
ncbi:MAG TPA: PDZ domain-containing protein [Sphingomonas sp.]|jgi:hypothetical protein|nr:PDZ domain-containing protein [Sphingomonas sp.]